MCDISSPKNMNIYDVIISGLMTDSYYIYRFGGIIPPVARDLHKQHIETVVNDALFSANVSLQVNII